MYWRRVAKRASLIAASTASVPELPMKDAGRAVDRRDLVQLGGQLRVHRQVEVGRAEVDQVARLALDRGGDARMGVAGRRDGDAGGEVEEDVAVDVLDRGATAAHGDEGIGARQAGRRELVIERDVAPRLRPGDLGPKIRNGLEIGCRCAAPRAQPARSRCSPRRSMHKTHPLCMK